MPKRPLTDAGALVSGAALTALLAIALLTPGRRERTFAESARPERPTLAAIAPAAAAEPPATVDPASASRAWLDALAGPDPLGPEARGAMLEGRWLEAIALLEAPRKEDDERARVERRIARGYAAMRADRAAICLKELGPIATASEHALADYTRLWAAECAWDQGDWHEAALFAARVADDAPGRERALYLLGESLLRSETKADQARAREVLEAHRRRFPKSEHAALVRKRLAEIARRAGDREAAYALWAELLEERPRSSLAPEAARILERAASEKKRTKAARRASRTALSEYAVDQIEADFDRHKSERVIESARRLLTSEEKGSERACRLLYLIGKSHTKLRQHADSIPSYERMSGECEAHPKWHRAALYLGGKARWNAGDLEGARRDFKALWEAHPDHSYADDAMHFAARVAGEQGRPEEMAKLLERQVARYPKGDMAADAHWFLMRSLLEAKDWAGAIAYEKEHRGRLGPTDLYNAGRLAYFAARAQELKGEKERAAEAYAEVARAWPLGYYALLAINRLAALEGASLVPGIDLCALPLVAKACAALPRTRGEIEVPDSVKSDPRFARGTALTRLGIEPAAAAEFAALRRAPEVGERGAWAVALYLDATGAYPLSHDIARRTARDWPDGYPDQDPGAKWRVAYPRPFAPEVAAWAKGRALPRSVVWAIMREESGFNPKIESWANARGLLQLMPTVGARLARQAGKASFDIDALYEPSTNLELGTLAMRQTADAFGPSPAMIIAGHNGGLGNVGRWISERGDEPLDLWVEAIPYGQTRNYTKRVLTSFWAYSWLTGEARVPALPFQVGAK